MIKEDIRASVFPLFTATESDGEVNWETNEYLGTAFFITKNGVALTAGHCSPDIGTLGDKNFYAAVLNEGEIKLYRVMASTVFDNIDIAILKVDINGAKYFPLVFDRLIMGLNVWTAGMPAHELRDGGLRIYRLLKGNVTYLSTFAELSFPAPKGMSGSPVCIGEHVAGVLTGNVKSEQLEDQFEEIVKVSEEKEIIKYVESKSIVNYGLAQELAPLKNIKHEIFGDDSFSDFIKRKNR